MKAKKLFSVILMTTLLCMNLLPASAVITEESYDLSETQCVSANGPVTAKIAIADEGDSASYDKITAYVGGVAVASADRNGDVATEIVFPANTFVPGVNTVEYRATLNGELYKTVSKRINAYKEVNDAVTILGAKYDNLTSISITGWQMADKSFGTNVLSIIADTNTTNAVKLEQEENGTNKYLKYAPTGTGTYLRMDWKESDTYNSGILKLSADIYVPDAETVTKTNTYCYSGAHQYDMSSYLKSGQWNKIHWLFNIDLKRYAAYVEGVGGTIGDWSYNVPNEISLTTKELRTEIYVNSGKYIYLDNLKLEHLSADYELFNISAPAEAVNSAELSIRPYISGTVETYVDGALIATDNATDTEITKVISADVYGSGIKTIKVKAILNNGKTYTKHTKINISTRTETGIGTASSELIDFNNLNEDCRSQVEALFTLQGVESDGSVTRIAGKSGEEGDYAALFNFGTVTTQDYDKGIIALAGTANQRSVLAQKGGKFVIEFDMMRYESSPNLYLRMPFGLWGTSTSQYLLNSGSTTLRDTTTTTQKDKWHGFKLEYDISNNQWKVWLDGTEVSLSNNSEPSGWTGDEVRFRFGRRPNGYQNKLALDNVRVYHVEEGAKVTSSSSAITCEQQSVNVTLDKAITAEGKVYCDGVLAEGFEVTTSDNITYTATGDFKANNEYRIAIGNISVPVYVTETNGIYLKIQNGKVENGKFTADIESCSLETVVDKINVITAAYKDNVLSSVSEEELSIGTSVATVTKQLTYNGEVTKAKMMIWNDMVPLVVAPEFTPAQ